MPVELCHGSRNNHDGAAWQQHHEGVQIVGICGLELWKVLVGCDALCVEDKYLVSRTGHTTCKKKMTTLSKDHTNKRSGGLLVRALRFKRSSEDHLELDEQRFLHHIGQSQPACKGWRPSQKEERLYHLLLHRWR